MIGLEPARIQFPGEIKFPQIRNGLSILNVSIEMQLVAKGIIIVLALALDRYLQFEKYSLLGNA